MVKIGAVTMAVVTTTSIGTALTNGRNREDNSRNKKKKDDTGGKKNNCKDEGKWYLHKAEGDTIFLPRDFAVNLFQNHPPEALTTGMKRLGEWNEATKKEWVRRC